MSENPFPGLDPYLEPFWSGLHARMVSAFSNQIQEQLPDGLWVDVEATVVVEGGKLDGGPSAGAGHGGLAVAEPLVISDELETTERWVVIVDAATRDRVVTAIEFLSPGNKCSLTGRERYRTRCAGYRSAGTNLVEIDLLRSGHHIITAPEHRIPEEAHSVVSVWRWHTLKWEIYPVPLRDPLPNFRIPLRPGDQEVVLRLQEAFNENYRQGRYPLRVDYTNPPSPRLPDEDQAWVNDRLTQQGLRQPG